ncbi:MAG: 3-phosphoserine/phosphohydroxythreonine transaminase [Bacteroidota bacterium]
MRGHNFSAGPGTLPTAVMEAVRDELLEYPNTGASIIEISHRSPQYTAVAASARALLRKLLGLGEEWHILFLQGGASTQFYQVAHNFLPSDGVATYVNTGNWSTKAIAEARRYGGVQVAASSEDAQFSYIPSEASWDVAEGSVYLHYTSNNTIFGTQYRSEPTVSMPLVCDASSDFLSRPLDLDRYGLIYAGAQKNIGPAGATVVLVRDDFLQTRRPDLPTMMDYGTHAAKLFNTPPVFAVYMVEKVLRWLDDLGGIPAIQAVNQQKADLLYGRIDRTDFYSSTARADSRSLMNVTFRLPSPELDAQFIAEAKANDLLNLKGYRTVGGIRASIYNACPLAAVEALVSFMDDFEAANG